MPGSGEPAEEANQAAAFVAGYLSRPDLDDDSEIAALVAEHLSRLPEVLRDRLDATQVELGDFELDLHFPHRSARVQGRDDDVHVDFY